MSKSTQDKSVQTIPTIKVIPAHWMPYGDKYQSKRPAEAFPRHKITGHTYGDRETVFIHTAGSSVIWEASIQDLMRSKRFIMGLSPLDALKLGYAAAQEVKQAVAL